MERPKYNRRDFFIISGGAAASFAVGDACRLSDGSSFVSDGRLKARPAAGTKTTAASGQIMLGLDRKRDAILQVPKTVGTGPLPMVVMLHGATQSAEEMFWYLGSAHEEAGVVVLAPNSRDTTWDAINGSFGPDIEFLNLALERAFNSVAVDSKRLAIGGFSDGATYGLSLGLINGDLFNRVVAFSPGFVIDGGPQGKPRVFISHGTRDHILPIDSCGRRVAAGLKARGYDVTFREFDGDHEVPPAVAHEGLQWVAK